jgi:hypothetical protein
MKGQRTEDRPYTAVVLAFLIGLVALGLLGVPALLVGTIGLAVAALAIVVFHRALEGRGRSSSRAAASRAKVPDRYVPRVLESGSMRRRRGVHLRRQRSPSPPLRFR